MVLFEALSIIHLGDINKYQVLLKKPSVTGIRVQLIYILRKYHLLYLDNFVIERIVRIDTKSLEYKILTTKPAGVNTFYILEFAN